MSATDSPSGRASARHPLADSPLRLFARFRDQHRLPRPASSWHAREVQRVALCLSLFASLLVHATPSRLPALDVPLPHDVHQPHVFENPAANDTRAIAVSTDSPEIVAVAAAAGIRLFAPDTASWQSTADLAALAPAFAIAPAPDGGFWVGAWNGLHRVQGQQVRPTQGIPGPVVAVGVAPDGRVLAGGPNGYFLVDTDRVRRLDLPATGYLSRIGYGPDRAWWFATGMGLFHWDGSHGHYRRGDSDQVSFATRAVAFDLQEQAWVASLGGLQRLEGNRLRKVVGPGSSLPSADIRALVRGPDGRLWAGTAHGLARQSDAGWQVRAGRRWLAHDEVRDLAFDSGGTAWIATAGGVSALRSETVSLSEKATRFHAVLESRHVRPPGIVEKCQLRTPGDLATWAPMDDDNDGGYTALALAMESYRYAATRDPRALAAARRAFAACELLRDVSGIPGFIARTVVPHDWTEVHDPNETVSDPAWAESMAGDPRAKRVPVRWRPSADGRWLWKGDTSSDEITAHFFGYFVFDQLAADATDKARVREHVVQVADHLLQNGLVLRDLDGKPTRWGIWAPEYLNDDPNWEMERGINSVEILSFLKLAHHLSGEARFEQAYRRLIRDHHYDQNVRTAPNLNPAWRTYIDMELLAFAYPALLALEKDPSLRRTFHESFERWHHAVQADGNPFFEFLYAAFRSPRRAQLGDALNFLRDTPLDLIRWDVDLTRREDLSWRRFPEVERLQTGRRLPVSEIGYSRTDQNPWLAVQGDGGRSESDGVFWLLPYWMGRHYGWVPGPVAETPRE